MKINTEFNYQDNIIAIEANMFGKEVIYLNGEKVSEQRNISSKGTHCIEVNEEQLQIKLTVVSQLKGNLVIELSNSQGLIESKTIDLYYEYGQQNPEAGVKFTPEEYNWKDELELPWYFIIYGLLITLVMLCQILEKSPIEATWPDQVTFYGCIGLAVIACTEIVYRILKQFKILSSQQKNI
ncbi:hypothetical protein C1E24_06995 [Pseudoalteromonas phenolica]|uniref:Uncharacterized protein n=1 Tax=Pseudoalteromonas phenolica TaxID=161398 RepID=A0A5R9Q529_9GAMM|nr:hypothetical protein [Pseudoalteromonas phenolica]TLX47732.1 hypothetical protein C1E24_06995 [Pseudoalteromonas phenolica]